jgi:hypothetical protein
VKIDQIFCASLSNTGQQEATGYIVVALKAVFNLDPLVMEESTQLHGGLLAGTGRCSVGLEVQFWQTLKTFRENSSKRCNRLLTLVDSNTTFTGTVCVMYFGE